MKRCGLHLNSRPNRYSGSVITLIALATPMVSQAQRLSESQKLAEIVPTASIGQALGNFTDFCTSGTGACMYVLLGAMVIALWSIFFAEVVKPGQESELVKEFVKPSPGRPSNISLVATAGIALLLILVAGIFFIA